MKTQQEEILIGSTLIKSFMKLDQPEIDYFWINNLEHAFKLEEMQYHSSWDWLMPVIEKIESLHDGRAFSIKIEDNNCEIIQNTQHWRAFQDTIDLPEIFEREGTKLENTHKAVIEFIKWYNTQK